MLTLYATPGSGNCFKPFLALHQLSIPFETLVVDVLAGETKGDAFLAVNPGGTVPYLRIAGGHGLGESNAMLWFIATGSQLIPDAAYERARGLQWMFFEQSRLEPFISPARFLTAIVPERGKDRQADIAGWRAKARTGLGVLDRYLEDTDFIAGPTYSIADIGVFGYVHLSGEAGVSLEAYPAIERWIARVESTPRYVPIADLCARRSKRLSEAA